MNDSNEAAEAKTERKIQRMVEASEAGEARGRAMVPGAKFIGAIPEADAAGFGDRIARRAFIEAFVRALPRTIITNRDGVIV